MTPLSRLVDLSGITRFVGRIEGGNPAGGVVTMKGPVSFAFNTPGLVNGVTLYTPSAGEWLVGWRFFLRTVWDGTTPLGDIGLFSAAKPGFLATVNAQRMDMTLANVLTAGIPYGGSVSLDSMNVEVLTGDSIFPTPFVTADPLQVVVSQDGTKGGADPGASQGACDFYALVATPA